MKLRDKILAKTNGHCAYCGKDINGVKWHIDHVIPIYRGYEDHEGDESFENKMPACARCNLWKGVLGVEEFRVEISKQVDRLRRYSRPFRMAEDYDLVRATGAGVDFYFERNPPREGELRQEPALSIEDFCDAFERNNP